MKFKKNILFLVILFVLIAIPLILFFFPITADKIQYVMKYELIIRKLIMQNYLFFIFLYSLFVFLCVLTNLPGGSIRAILAGYFLGTIIGIILIITITTLSSMILFLFYKNKIYKRYNFNLLNINKILPKIKKEFILLIAIRLIPIIPFFLQNILIAKFNISTFRYLTTTAIGIFPTNMLYLLIGSELEDVVNLMDLNIGSILLENDALIYIILILISYLIFTNILAIKSRDK